MIAYIIGAVGGVVLSVVSQAVYKFATKQVASAESAVKAEVSKVASDVAKKV